MTKVPNHDPDTHCIKCDRRYGIADEECRNCGFNPIDGGADEEENEAAVVAWEERSDGE